MTNKEIMSNAWKIAREGQKAFGGKVSEYFSEALKQAWIVAKASKKQISHGQLAVMVNCGIYSSERRTCGVPASITQDEIDNAENAFKPFWLDGTLTERQQEYAVWYYLLGEKAVDRWIWLYA